MDPRRPRGDRMPETRNVPCRAATPGIVPTRPDSPLRGYSVISLAPFSRLCGKPCSADRTLWRGKGRHTGRTTGSGYRVFKRRPVGSLVRSQERYNQEYPNRAYRCPVIVGSSRIAHWSILAKCQALGNLLYLVSETVKLSSPTLTTPSFYLQTPYFLRRARQDSNLRPAD
jgi:hypothetical protein